MPLAAAVRAEPAMRMQLHAAPSCYGSVSLRTGLKDVRRILNVLLGTLTKNACPVPNADGLGSGLDQHQKAMTAARATAEA